MDSLPPQPPPAYAAAPSDIYPRNADEEKLCAEASHPDWFYLGGLLALDVGAIGYGSSADIKFSTSEPVRTLIGPGLIGLAWGATIGGTWLALPKCEPHWVGETPPEGGVRATWPLALSLALLAGATAPIVNAIAIGSYNLPLEWSTEERAMHLVVAGVAGFGGALLPYLLPPRTWAAARELDRLRFGTDGHGNAYIGYSAVF